MSYNLNSYHSTTSPRCATTSGVSEVAAGMPNIRRYLCDTQFENFSSFSTWTVKGLTNLPVGTTSIESPPVPHQNSSKWCMVLTKQSDGLYLGFLLKTCEKEKSLRAMLKADETLPSGDKREVFPSMWCSLSRGGKSDQKLIRSSGALKNEDGITLLCEISILCGVHNKLYVAKAAEPHVGVMRVMQRMLDEEILTDFSLHAGASVLNAHRAVLCAQSPYFAAMLQPHTKEAQEGRMDVCDVKPEVLEQILQYMYKGVAPALKEMPWAILIAADKYLLQQLKAQCEAHIAGCLNVENAAETAAKAHMFSCDTLWDRAVYYIKQNLPKVMASAGWHDIITTHPKAVQCISELMA